MVRGVRWYLVGSAVLGSLAALGGCSGGKFMAEREAWRHDAEVACLSSGLVKEGEGKVRIKPINGPGMCGADFPIKVSALGESAPLAFWGDARPPAAVPSAPQRWPGAAARGAASPDASYDQSGPEPALPPSGYPASRAGDDAPLPLEPANAGSAPDMYDFRKPYGAARRTDPPLGGRRAPEAAAPPALGPSRAPVTAMAGTVAVNPPATLACPVISKLDQWIAGAVQPAAMRWLGQPVVEIRQISAYSCRGMNGNPNARISEHAFGNALDIAAFTLADGRKLTVKNGWHGTPEEQGFLRDVQGAACDQFTTVLAPGSNVFHYDHIHVDLMRRANNRRACNPHAVSGEEIAAKVRGRYAGKRGSEPSTTGSIPSSRPVGKRMTPNAYAPRTINDLLPLAVPGADGED